MTQSGHSPGRDWIAIITRPTLDAFAAAFTDTVVLETSVGTGGLVGAASIRQFFDATRAMYEKIAFTRETSAGALTCLEWEGSFQGSPIAGATLIARDGAGLIESIRLYHRPYPQVLAFSAELSVRLRGTVAPDLFVP